jgi:hypothetical protein
MEVDHKKYHQILQGVVFVIQELETANLMTLQIFDVLCQRFNIDNICTVKPG